jgi:hypothetical protein
VGYNSTTQQFTLFNPWGVSGGPYTPPDGPTVTCGGTVIATAQQLSTVYNGEALGAGAAPAPILAAGNPTAGGLEPANGSGPEVLPPTETDGGARSLSGSERPSLKPADAVFAALAQQFLPAGGTPSAVPARPPAAAAGAPNPVDSRAGLALLGRPGADPSATDLGAVPLADAESSSPSLTDAWFTDLGDDPLAPVGADPWLDRPW